MPAGKRQPWIALLQHVLTATAARLTGRWRKGAEKLIATIGGTGIGEALTRWMPLVSKGRTLARIPEHVHDTRGGGDLIHEDNATILRGLLWLAPLLPGRERLIRSIAGVALSAYKKIPGVGPRAVKVGNAAVYALSEMVTPETMGQLAVLKVRVRFGTAQKEIEKAFDAAARQLDLPRDEIEELGVPTTAHHPASNGPPPPP